MNADRLTRRQALRLAGRAGLAATSSVAWACRNDDHDPGVQPSPAGAARPGRFSTVGGRIHGPDGSPFLSLGAHAVCRPWPVPSWWLDRAAANGRVADAKAWGWNTIRLHLSTRPERGGSRAALFDGILRTIDEYTAAGIVVIPVSFDHQRGEPTLAELARSGVIDLQDELVAAHGANPYLWLNPLDEPWANGDPGRWADVALALHDRARSQGFDGLFVWDLPRFGQAIDLLSTSSVGSDLRARTTDLVFGWHNFGAAPGDRQDHFAQRALDLHLPVHIGGFGQVWDTTRPSRSPDWPTMDRDERRGADWVFSRFFRFGMGAVFWHGTGYVGGETSLYCLREGTNVPWYDRPGAPPLSEAGRRMMALGTELLRRTTTAG